MKLRVLALFIGLLGLSSCLKNELEEKDKENEAAIQSYIKARNLTMTKSPEGAYYNIVSTGNGKTPLLGDWVQFHYTLSLLNGIKVDSTSKTANQPYSQIFGGFINIFHIPIGYLKQGDKASFILPSRLAFGSNSSNGIPAYSVVRLDLEVLSIKSNDALLQSMQDQYGLVDGEKTVSGVIFKKTKENPTGTQLNVGMAGSMKYTGKLGYNFWKNDKNGKLVYDAIFDEGDLNFSFGGNLIKGFEEALLKMRVGEKAKFILPYNMAYGAQARGSIPAYSPLYFEVEIVSAN